MSANRSKDTYIRIYYQDAVLLTILIGLVKSHWEGDKAGVLSANHFTEDDVQRLASRLLEFRIRACEKG
jgi:hypothetical protein